LDAGEIMGKTKVDDSQLNQVIAFYESFKPDFKYQFLDVSGQLMHQYTLMALNELKERRRKEKAVK
jgi:hypothetical protein